MSSELCPRCGTVRNMVMTHSWRKTTGPGGRVKKIQTHLFHCETCNAFVRSEDTELREGMTSGFEARSQKARAEARFSPSPFPRHSGS